MSSITMSAWRYVGERGRVESVMSLLDEHGGDPFAPAALSPHPGCEACRRSTRNASPGTNAPHRRAPALCGCRRGHVRRTRAEPGALICAVGRPRPRPRRRRRGGPPRKFHRLESFGVEAVGEGVVHRANWQAAGFAVVQLFRAISLERAEIIGVAESPHSS